MDNIYADFKVHNHLNSRLWDGEKLRPEVEKKLQRIADEFQDSLDLDVDREDAILVGSSANYNYSRHSDIDVHLVVDFKKVNDDKDLVKDLVDSKKIIWNDEHQITVRGHEVEVYVQDKGEEVQSTGIYSLDKGKWLEKPRKDDPSFDLGLVKRKAEWMMELIDDAMDSPQRSDELDKLFDKIKKSRRRGLEEKGEFSEDNLAFKVLRRLGYLQQIWDTQTRDFDSELSLEGESLAERFKKTGQSDESGRQILTYDDVFDGILGRVTNREVSRHFQAAIGFPIFSAFVTRPKMKGSPEYVEDVLESLKGRSSKYVIPESERMKYVDEGSAILSDYVSMLLRERSVWTQEQWSYIFRGIRKYRNANNIPVVILEVPSSAGHTREISDALENHLPNPVVRDVMQMKKAGLGDESPVYIEPSDVFRRTHDEKIKKGETDQSMEEWEEEYAKSLVQWMNHMKNQGKSSFSISSVPSQFRQHVRGFIQADDESDDKTGEIGSDPFILILVDDNNETGFSMKATRQAALDKIGSSLNLEPNQLPPVIGLTLFNLSNSGTSHGGPRRGTQSQR